MEQEPNEALISRCPSCSEPLRWERVSGENVESWIGRCECGWIRVLRLAARAFGL